MSQPFNEVPDFLLPKKKEESQKKPCPTCKAGLVVVEQEADCYTCRGAGYSRSGAACENCKATGKVLRKTDKKVVCEDCKGTGWQ